MNYERLSFGYIEDDLAQSLVGEILRKEMYQIRKNNYNKQLVPKLDLKLDILKRIDIDVQQFKKEHEADIFDINQKKNWRQYEIAPIDHVSFSDQEYVHPKIQQGCALIMKRLFKCKKSVESPKYEKQKFDLKIRSYGQLPEKQEEDEEKEFQINDTYVKNLDKIVSIADKLETHEPVAFSGDVDEKEYNHKLLVICFNFLNNQFNKLQQSDTSQRIQKLDQKNNLVIASNFDHLYDKHVKQYVVDRLDVGELPVVEDGPGIVLFPKSKSDEKMVFQELPIGDTEPFAQNDMNDNLRVIKQLISTVAPISQDYKQCPKDSIMSQKYDINLLFSELKMEEITWPKVEKVSVKIDDQGLELHKLCSQYLKSFEFQARQYNGSTGPYDDPIMSFEKIDSLLGPIQDQIRIFKTYQVQNYKLFDLEKMDYEIENEQILQDQNVSPSIPNESPNIPNMYLNPSQFQDFDSLLTQNFSNKIDANLVMGLMSQSSNVNSKGNVSVLSLLDIKQDSSALSPHGYTQFLSQTSKQSEEELMQHFRNEFEDKKVQSHYQSTTTPAGYFKYDYGNLHQKTQAPPPQMVEATQKIKQYDYGNAPSVPTRACRPPPNEYFDQFAYQQNIPKSAKPAPSSTNYGDTEFNKGSVVNYSYNAPNFNNNKQFLNSFMQNFLQKQEMKQDMKQRLNKSTAVVANLNFCSSDSDEQPQYD